MSFTSKQITDLNNSMVAAQNVSLGTVVSSLEDDVVALQALTLVTSGSISPSSAEEIITTGLTSVTSVVASLSGSPTINHAWVSAVSGSTAGDIHVYCWAPTGTGDVTPVASSGNFVDVNWIATGE